MESTLTSWWREHSHWNIVPEYGQTVLEVGPGLWPCPYATQFLDITNSPERKLSGPLTLGNIENMPFRNKQFDIVVCSHVLEHACRPDAAIRELQRVGKAGVIEVPSTHKDFLVQHGNVHTRWQITKTGRKLVFVKLDSDLLPYFNSENIRNAAWNAAWGGDEGVLRDLFWLNKPLLNPTLHWDYSQIIEAVVIYG